MDVLGAEYAEMRVRINIIDKRHDMFTGWSCLKKITIFESKGKNYDKISISNEQNPKSNAAINLHTQSGQNANKIAVYQRQTSDNGL